MQVDDFITARKSQWERLTTLINQSQRRGLTTLSAEELYDLGTLYRSATADLAVARRDFAGHRVVAYLNGLVSQAHGTVYRSKATRGRALIEFFTITFPRTFRATWPYTLASFLMFVLPAIVGFVITFQDPTAAGTLLPGSEPIIDDIRNQREWWKSINEDGRAASASFIMTNNIRVAILAFAGGILLGTLSLLVLVQNGLMLGVLAGAAQALNFSSNLWGFIAAHGTIELSVIFISGGAGLQLGWSLIRPGLLTRRAALTLAARRAMHLLLGGIVLLVIAGLIEGFVSPSDLPLAVKLAVSLLSGILLYGYLFLAGRERTPRTARY